MHTGVYVHWGARHIASRSSEGVCIAASLCARLREGGGSTRHIRSASCEGVHIVAWRWRTHRSCCLLQYELHDLLTVAGGQLVPLNEPAHPCTSHHITSHANQVAAASPGKQLPAVQALCMQGDHCSILGLKDVSFTVQQFGLITLVRAWSQDRARGHDSLVSCNVWVVPLVDRQLQWWHSVSNIHIEDKVVLLALMELIPSSNCILTRPTHNSPNLLPFAPVCVTPCCSTWDCILVGTKSCKTDMNAIASACLTTMTWWLST